MNPGNLKLYPLLICGGTVCGGTYRTETKDGFRAGSIRSIGRKDIGDGQNPTKFKPTLITTFVLFG